MVLLVLIAWAMQERAKSILLWAVIGGGIIAYASAMPFYYPIFGYTGIIAIAWFFRKQVWQSPITAMLFITFVASLVYQLGAIVALKLVDIDISLNSSLLHTIIPSVILNLMAAFPIYTLLRDLCNWLYPPEVV